MNQEQINSIIKAKSKTRMSNIVGVFVFILGVSILLLGPASYFESLSDNVAEVNKTSGEGLVWSLIFGSIVFSVGYWLIKLRRKITRFDLAGEVKTNMFIWVFDKNTCQKAMTANRVVVSLSPKGIFVGWDSENDFKIELPWHKIKRARWRSIYFRDAYELNTDDYDLVFLYNNPLSSREDAREYWIRSWFFLGKIKALSILAKNEVDKRELTPLYAYMRAYKKTATNSWGSYQDLLLFGQILSITTIVILTVWAVGYTRGLDYNEIYQVIAILSGIFLGFGLLLYMIIKELMFSRYITATEHLQ